MGRVDRKLTGLGCKGEVPCISGMPCTVHYLTWVGATEATICTVALPVLVPSVAS